MPRIRCSADGPQKGRHGEGFPGFAGDPPQERETAEVVLGDVQQKIGDMVASGVQPVEFIIGHQG